MNVNLAPVLDVYRTPGDFDDQFGRSYSMNPDVVSRLGADFITAQQHVGVAATAKHFPGLGAAARSQDTDVAPVTLNLPASTIRGVDEFPYRAAIGAGVKLVMVSWAVYPSLGSKRPAGLSGLVIGELRTRLGFKGVTITDALEAGAPRAPLGGDPYGIAVPPGRANVITLAAASGASFLDRSAKGGKPGRRRRTPPAGGLESPVLCEPDSRLDCPSPAGQGSLNQLLRTSDAGRTWHHVGF